MPLFIGRWMECGYGVEFGSFPAGSAFEAEYEIGPLPDTLDRNYEVVLALDTAEDLPGEGWTASFSIEDAEGTLVVQSDGMEGGSWQGRGAGHVYQMLPKGWKEFVGRHGGDCTSRVGTTCSPKSRCTATSTTICTMHRSRASKSIRPTRSGALHPL